MCPFPLVALGFPAGRGGWNWLVEKRAVGPFSFQLLWVGSPQGNDKLC